MTEEHVRKFLHFCIINEIVLPSKVGDYICQFANEIEKELQEENEKLKKNNNDLFNATERVGRKNNELQAENEHLKEVHKSDCKSLTMIAEKGRKLEKQLNEAKTIIRGLLKYIFSPEGFEELDKDMIMKAEAFVKE